MFLRLFAFVCVVLAVGCATTPVDSSGSIVPTVQSTTLLTVPAKPDPVEVNSAKLLQTWLRKAFHTDSGFAIVTESRAAEQIALADRGLTVIAVGRTRWADPAALAPLREDGFIIRQKGRVISICGQSFNGTRVGTATYLDKFVGVRFWMPDDFWTSLPDHPPKLAVEDAIVSQPFVSSCDMTGNNNKIPGYADWLRLIGAWRLKGGTHQHNLYKIFPPAKYATRYPLIYPVYNGQRYLPQSPTDQNWQVDFSEPTTVLAAEESIRDYFKADPDDLYVAISINDTWSWYENETYQKVLAQLKARDPKKDFTHEATSEIYWRFMNQVAQWLKKNYPGKLLVGLAYGPTAPPPPFKLEDNIVAYANFHVAELPADKFMLAENGQPSPLDQWLAVTRHFGNHDWYEGAGYMIPRIYSGYWSQFMRGLARRIPDAFMHAEAYPNWGFDGPKFYITAKLWWDPSLDPKALTRQFCDDMFGPSSPAMYRYFNELEALWQQLDVTDGPERKIERWGNQFVTTPASRAMVARCRTFLDQAAAAAQTPAQKQRIEFFSKPFAFSETLFALQAAPTGNVSLYEKALKQAVELGADRMAVFNPEQPKIAVEAVYRAKPKP